MTAPKLKQVLSIICRNLSDSGVPHALIGAMAMALYGMPRYTADIDLLCDESHRKAIKEIMTRLGYNCYNDSDNFAQFDSELGVLGNIDFLFAQTKEGRAIIERRVVIKDDVLGDMPIVQPTDYAVLKLMAIANDPSRQAHDTADLETLLKASTAGLMNPKVKPIDIDHLKTFAKRFGILKQLSALLIAPTGTGK
jgi:hypothetical protein